MSNNASDARNSPPHPHATEALGGRWVWPPLILAITALLVWSLGRTPREAQPGASPVAPSPSPAAAVTPQ